MKLESKQKIVLLSGLLTVMTAGLLLYFISFLDRDVSRSKKEELTNTALPSSKEPPSYWFLLDEGGYSPPTDHDDTPIQFTVATGTSIPVGAGVNELADFDPVNIRITVLGETGTRELAVTKRPEDGIVMYVATYIPERPGKEMITIEILGTTHREFVEVFSYSRDLLNETGLIREDIIWEARGFGIAETVKPSSGTTADQGWSWALEEPGYLRMHSKDELTKTEGELRIYDISPLERYRNGELLSYFYDHILKLDQYIENQRELSVDEHVSLYSFPPTNAAMLRLERDQAVKGNNFDGISYIHAGYFQAYDPAKQPTYIFQGISHDKKFFVYYQQELYSESLRKYLRAHDSCMEKECIDGSFELLQQDQNLDPDPVQLNQTMKSLGIRQR